MKKLANSILSGAAIVFSTACQDHLDVQSTSQLTLDNYYTTYEECRMATAPLYNVVWYDFSSQFYFRVGDGRGNNLFMPYGGTGDPFTTLTETIETGLLLNGWRSLYVVVAQSDYVVNNLDNALEHGVPVEQVNACKAEARFMRGLAYWYLSAAWGNVPIIEDPAALAKNFTVNTNPFEDVLQYAIRDLEFAAEWLPETDVRGRLTKYSALGALARVYISAACYARGNRFSGRWTTSAGEYYQRAKDAAGQVCESTHYSLMDDYEELFRVQNNNNSESLFALQFVAGSSVYGVGNRNQDWLAYSTELTDGLNAWGGSNFAAGELVKLMHDRGELKRKKAAFFYPGAVYDYLGGHTDEGYWEILPGDQSIRYPTIKKHVVGGKADTEGAAINGNSGLAAPMLRLAEVYLLYAEAILGTNDVTADPEALLYFNRVRTRAGLEEVTEITLGDIWDERRCELALEGQFWFDMVRRAYWDQQWVLNYMAGQHRAQYYYYLSGSAPDGFVWRDQFPDHEMNPPSPDRLLLPYPVNELVMNPLLREDPVPFDFGEEN